MATSEAEIEELDFQKVLAETSLEKETCSQKIVKCGDCGADSVAARGGGEDGGRFRGAIADLGTN